MHHRENPTRAEMQTLDKKCLPIFKYFRPQRKTKVLVHGFGDSAEDSLMFPLLRDGMYLLSSEQVAGAYPGFINFFRER